MSFTAAHERTHTEMPYKCNLCDKVSLTLYLVMLTFGEQQPVLSDADIGEQQPVENVAANENNEI